MQRGVALCGRRRAAAVAAVQKRSDFATVEELVRAHTGGRVQEPAVLRRRSDTRMQDPDRAASTVHCGEVPAGEPPAVQTVAAASGGDASAASGGDASSKLRLEELERRVALLEAKVLSQEHLRPRAPAGHSASGITVTLTVPFDTPHRPEIAVQNGAPSDEP
eukprot:TRINITY_DN4736_c0_g1_i3.p2 TRINITY_DN4736_c0_g1~~TRINITY_DN4736_c0_g1_i3.p2  ORF type:complete len:163 (+),score=22.44 TRINITY_DN4736_c0_g1_i3:69-557(+)